MSSGANVIRYYSSREIGQAEEIEKLLVDRFADNVVEIHRSVDSLARSFRIPRGDEGVAILVVANGGELTRLLSIRRLLKGAASRIVMVLPDQEDGLLGLAHRLRPSFIAYADDDPALLSAVLEKIIREPGPNGSHSRSHSHS
jgi:hypothetical protein